MIGSLKCYTNTRDEMNSPAIWNELQDIATGSWAGNPGEFKVTKANHLISTI